MIAAVTLVLIAFGSLLLAGFGAVSILMDGARLAPVASVWVGALGVLYVISEVFA